MNINDYPGKAKIKYEDNKEYIKAEKELANVIFNGINVQGYE